MVISKKSEKTNKFVLKLSTSTFRFPICIEHSQGCYTNILISYKIWTQVIKKQTNFSSKVVPVGQDYLFARGTAMVAMEKQNSIYQKPLKLNLCYNNVAIFTPSCKWHDMVSSYITNKPAINSEYNKEWIDKNPILFFN